VIAAFALGYVVGAIIVMGFVWRWMDRHDH
jgi:hypothetical protein